MKPADLELTHKLGVFDMQKWMFRQFGPQVCGSFLGTDFCAGKKHKFCTEEFDYEKHWAKLVAHFCQAFKDEVLIFLISIHVKSHGRQIEHCTSIIC